MQTAAAVENPINHQRPLDYARLSEDLDTARAIQQSLSSPHFTKVFTMIGMTKYATFCPDEPAALASL